MTIVPTDATRAKMRKSPWTGLVARLLGGWTGDLRWRFGRNLAAKLATRPKTTVEQANTDPGFGRVSERQDKVVSSDHTRSVSHP